jgi:transposase, IS6 family
MARGQRAAEVRPDQSFKGRQFTAEVILWAVRWYVMFPISYRDLELMLQDRGVSVDHTTIYRWIQAYAPEIEKRIRPHLRSSNGSWRVDETYVKMKGRWMYLYRAVDSRGQTIDFLLSAKRDAEAAKRFFRKALGQPHKVNPRTITVDKNPAYPCTVTGMKQDRRLTYRPPKPFATRGNLCNTTALRCSASACAPRRRRMCSAEPRCGRAFILSSAIPVTTPTQHANLFAPPSSTL